MGFLAVGLGVLVVLLWVGGTYNGLVRLRNHCREAWADIDTELKRRYDLIPNLVETVKAYARHERETLRMVVEARQRALASTGSPASQAEEENSLVRTLRQLLALVEAYPDLKADRHFLALQRELADTEDRIQAARRFYNANVRDLNNRVETFPSSLVASMFGFRREEFFEVEGLGLETAPRVGL